MKTNMIWLLPGCRYPTSEDICLKLNISQLHHDSGNHTDTCPQAYGLPPVTKRSHLSLMMLLRHDDTTMIPAVVAMMAWIEDTSLRQRHKRSEHQSCDQQLHESEPDKCGAFR